MNDPASAPESRARWLLKAVVLVLWTFALIAVYFWAHKPFDAGLVRGLGGSMVAVVIWFAVTALGAALGRRLLSPVLAGEAPAIRLALAAGAGLGLLALIIWAMGMSGLFRPRAAWALVALLALFLRRDLVAVAGDLRAIKWPLAESWWERWLLFYAAAVLGMAFTISLTPPTAWDTLVYHLTGPRLFIEAGRIVHPIDLPYLGFPQLLSMQFTLGMLLGGDRVPALFHYRYGLMALTITAGLAYRAFGRRAAWLATILLISVPTLVNLIDQPYVDGALLFYATAAFYAFFRWRQQWLKGREGQEWLLVLGLMAGLGGGVKYTAALVPLALGLSLLWCSRRDGLLASARRLALVALVAAAAVLPWLLENWLTTGNPVYPFFFDDALYWNEWRGWWYSRPGTGLAATAPWRLPLVPLEATLLGTEGSDLYEATIGPLLLVGAGALAVVWRTLSEKEKGIAGHMILFFGLNYLFWLYGVARSGLLLQTRLLLPVFGVAATLAGTGLVRLERWQRPELDVNWIVRTAVALTLVLLLFTRAIDFLALNPLPVVVGLESRAVFLERRLGAYQQVIQHLETLPQESVILFLWEPRSYQCTTDCRPDALLDRFLHETQHLQRNAAEIAEAWRAAGATHVLLHERGLEFIVEAGFDPLTSYDLAVLTELEEEHLQRVMDWGDEYTLYRLE